MSESIEIVREFLGLMKQKNAELLRPYLTEDAEYLMQGLYPAKGIDEVIAYQADQFDIFPGLYDRQILNIAATEDDTMVMTERWDITTSPQGHTVGVPVAGVFTLRDGKIASWVDYTDRLMRANFLWVPAVPDRDMNFEEVQKMYAQVAEYSGRAAVTTQSYNEQVAALTAKDE